MQEVEKNNFKELQKQQEEEYHQTIDSIKSKVDGNMNSLGFLGKIIDVYFSKLFNFMKVFSGGTTDSDDVDDNK